MGKDVGLYDSEIKIGSGSGNEYRLAALRLPAGEARWDRIFPFEAITVEIHLQNLGIGLF